MEIPALVWKAQGEKRSPASVMPSSAYEADLGLTSLYIAARTAGICYLPRIRALNMSDDHTLAASPEPVGGGVRPWLLVLAKLASILVLISGAALAWVQIYVNYAQHESDLLEQRRREMQGQESAALAAKQTAEFQLKAKQLEFDLQERAALRKEQRDEAQEKRQDLKEQQKVVETRRTEIDHDFDELLAGNDQALARLYVNMPSLSRDQRLTLIHFAFDTIEVAHDYQGIARRIEILETDGASEYLRLVPMHANQKIQELAAELTGLLHDASVVPHLPTTGRGLTPLTEVRALLQSLDTSGNCWGGQNLLASVTLDTTNASNASKLVEISEVVDLAERIRLQRVALFLACSADVAQRRVAANEARQNQDKK